MVFITVSAGYTAAAALAGAATVAELSRAGRSVLATWTSLGTTSLGRDHAVTMLPNTGDGLILSVYSSAQFSTSGGLIRIDSN